MKKILAICLTCCMLFTCASTTAFAAEETNASVVQTEDVVDVTDETGIMPLNTDYWTTEVHHWADIVTHTNGGTYTVRLIGPAYVTGGFYSEP